MLPAPRATIARLLACAAIPLTVLAAALRGYRGVAPLWAGGSTDPSYAYLLSSLLAAELKVPVKTDHPGITVELVGALVLRLWHALSGSPAPLREHVLRDPEPFLAAIVGALLVAVTAASVFLGWAVWRVTGRAWLAALAQLSPYVCFEVLRSLVQVMCEPLLLAGATVVSGLVLLTLLPETRTTRGLELAMGIVLGLGLATKVVFLPAALPMLIVARSRGGRARLVLAAAAVFGVCLLVIAPRLPATVSWMWRLFAHSGYHGLGANTVIDPERYAGGFVRLIRAELPLHAAFVTSLAVCLWPGGPAAFPSSARRAALGLFAAWAVTMLAAAKLPQAHYLVTAAGLLPALVILALWRAQLGEPGRGTVLARAAVLVVLAAGAAHAVRGAIWLRDIRRGAKAGARTVAEAAAREPRVLYGHRASTIPAALASGDEWTDLAFSADLRRLYPRFLAFDCEGLQAFGEPVAAGEVEARLKPDGTVLMQEAAWRRLDECPWTAALPRKAIASGGRDALYEARLLPPPPHTDMGPWIGGMLVVAGMEAGAGPQRWATAPRSSLLSAARDGPLTLEVTAGHDLPGPQSLTVIANGVRLHSQALPKLPATGSFTVPIPPHSGWNEIEIVYDAVAEAAGRVESPQLGHRLRARSRVTPAVRFDRLRLVGPG